MGGAVLLATVAAQWMVGRLASAHPAVRMLGLFVSAFALYELALYAVAVTMLGGIGAFAPRILGEVLLVNAVALVGLIGLHHVVSMAAVLRRRQGTGTAPARVA